MAKCPTRATIAGDTRAYRWSNCADHLAREAALFDLRAVITIGTGVHSKLKRCPWASGRQVFNVLHYSPLAASYHARVLVDVADRNLDSLPIEKFLAFLDERRVALDAIKARSRGGIATNKPGAAEHHDPHVEHGRDLTPNLTPIGTTSGDRTIPDDLLSGELPK